MKAKCIFVGHVELRSKLSKSPLNTRNAHFSPAVEKKWTKGAVKNNNGHKRGREWQIKLLLVSHEENLLKF